MNITIILSIIVFIFYAHTLGSPWKHFDEQLIYSEILTPIPNSIIEYIEIIKNFGLNNHFEASNVFYTSISNLRGTPFDTLFCLTLFLLFKKNVFLYRLFPLIIHIINTILLGKIINKVFSINKCQDKQLTIIVLTLIWALHPVNVESILFATNIAALITYSFCMFFMNYYLTDTKKNRILIFFLYLIPLFLSEHTITFPLILFSILLSFEIHHNKLTIANAIKKTFQDVLPFLIAAILFIIHFFLDITRVNLNISNSQNINLIMERIFWISPQIFIHSIKLILFPIHLTIDQTGNIIFSNSLLSPYGIFCSIILYGLIISQIVCTFYLKKKNIFNIFITLTPFIISIILYLNFISFSYCLFSERYLYFPTFFLAFGLANIIAGIENLKLQKKYLISIFACLILLGTRAYIRTLDWKDSTSLFLSAYKENKSPLLKALRLQFAGSILQSNRTEEIQLLGKSYIEESKSILKNYYNNLNNDSNKQSPEIIKFYGLDNKSLKLKTAYLLSFEKYELEGKKEEAFEVLKQDFNENTTKDQSIISFYINLANELGNENINSIKILESSLKTNLNLGILLTLADIYKSKKEYKKSEEYLNIAIKYFPYNVKALYSLSEIYNEMGDLEKSNFYLNLFKLRTHQK